LGRLAVTGLELGAEFPRPAADRISAQERKSPTIVLLPNLELGLLLEDPHQDRRFLGHVLSFQRRQHPLRQWLHVAAAGRPEATGRTRQATCVRQSPPTPEAYAAELVKE